MHTEKFEIQLEVRKGASNNELLEKMYLLDTELQDKFLKPISNVMKILDYIFNNFDSIKLTEKEWKFANDLLLRIHKESIKMYQQRTLQIGRFVNWPS